MAIASGMIDDDVRRIFAEELVTVADEIVRDGPSILKELREAGLGFGLVWHDYWQDKLSDVDLKRQAEVEVLSLRAGFGQGLIYSEEWRSLVLQARAKAKLTGRQEDAALDPLSRLLLSRTGDEIRGDNEIIEAIFIERLRHAVQARADSVSGRHVKTSKVPPRLVLSILEQEFPNMRHDTSIANRGELCLSRDFLNFFSLGVCVDLAALRRHAVHVWPIMKLNTPRQEDRWRIIIANIEAKVQFPIGYQDAAELELMLRCKCWMIRRVFPIIEIAAGRGIARVAREKGSDWSIPCA